MSCCQTFNRSMIAGERKSYTVDVSQIAVADWERNAIFAASAVVSPTAANATGFLYQNGSTEGQSGPFEPNWPIPAGQTIPDGSLTWAAIVPPATGEDSIASIAFVQLNPPDGALSVSGQIASALTVDVVLGGGTSGNVYTTNVVNTMTSGLVYIAQIVLTVQ
jgi:hypothetical protein